jgi:diaminohydroxyphosphoribosylaminopyrimidine deaminase/5-amino-6-(5-phosphoribosylamino)uracil reductase
VHQLRSQCDAVIVGGGTLRADDPLLTSRGQRTPEPLRVVLSRSLQLPDRAQLWDTTPAATLVAHPPDAPAAAKAQLQELCSNYPGLEALELPHCSPAALLEALAQRGCNQVLWECGPVLAAAALREGCVQQVAAVIAPKLLGGTPARTPLGELGLQSMDQVQSWQVRRLQHLGPDLLWNLSALR